MKLRKQTIALAIASILSWHAAGAGSPADASEPASAGWQGTVCAGPVYFPRYVGGRSMRLWWIPILSVNYDDIFYVEIQRAGAYLFSTDDRKFGLGVAVEPRFGYTSRDGVRLAGMQSRADSLEGGLTIDWDLDYAAISLAHFHDVTRKSRGSATKATLYIPVVKTPSVEIGGVFSVDRLSRRTAGYYFGVRPDEALPDRRQFTPSSGMVPAFGMSATFKFGNRRALTFGANRGMLGATFAASPIVETRRSTMYFAGYGIAL